MWVRSQDKRQLLNVNDFRVQGCYINSDEKMANLGKYSTHEKALKVLDMIQERISENYSDRQVPYTEEKYRAYYVFQMPQDDEVEENE